MRRLAPLVLLAIVFGISLLATVISNDRPFFVVHEGRWYFPIVKSYSGSHFGTGAIAEPDYRELVTERSLFPVVPFGPYRTLSGEIPPTAPDRRHWLGTDDHGRDLFSRLIYGLRNSLLFALLTSMASCGLALIFGGIQAYRGGWVDAFGRRVLEIWGALPILYLFLLIKSRVDLGLLGLVVVWSMLGWVATAHFVRAEAIRVREMEFTHAARLMGGGFWRIFAKHWIPNIVPVLVALLPYLVIANLTALTGLDLLGLGLPAPSASLGELLAQGRNNLSSWWLVWFPVTTVGLVFVLIYLSGEAVRKAFDVLRT